MFSLLSGLWRYVFQKDEYFVLILGLDNAGKTTYLEQTKTKFNKDYKAMNPSKITTTVGLNIGKIDIENVRLNFWDLGGQEELQSLWDKYYAESHAVIYIVDSSDQDRIEESKQAFDQMIGNDMLHGVPLLLLANKQDLQDCLSLSTIKGTFQESGVGKLGSHDCKAMAVSALTGDGVDEGIRWLVHCIVRNNLVRPPTQRDI
jgi:ADP-ribosylation factor related protein 1